MLNNQFQYGSVQITTGERIRIMKFATPLSESESILYSKSQVNFIYEKKKQ